MRENPVISLSGLRYSVVGVTGCMIVVSNN